MSDATDKQAPMDQLRELMRRLRDPKDGCPWDRKQSFESITAYTLEETYELIDAIASEDPEAIRGELGDLLFQVVFYSQMADELGWFTMDDVAQAMVDKLLRRHPHVFPDGTLASRASDGSSTKSDEIKARWEAIKQTERDERGQQGVLDDVPAALPALSRSAKLQKRAARVGFDWDSMAGVLDKVDEEVGELKEALALAEQGAIEHELGDALFSLVNVARHAGIDPESAMRLANRRFESRFRFIEQRLLASGRHPQDVSLAEMEALWQQAKQHNATSQDH